MERSQFGKLAIDAGYLTPAALRRAEQRQLQDLLEGKSPRPLGIVCLQEGWMTYAQMVMTLERAQRRAGRLPRALNLVRRSRSNRDRSRQGLMSRRSVKLAELS